MKEFDYYMAQKMRLDSGLEGDIDYIVLPELKENIRNNLFEHYEEKREEYLESLKDSTTFKGKKILASRLCPENKNMYWMSETYKGETTIKEMGCMTKKENETYWRKRTKEYTTFNGKKYIASRICPEGENMRWQKVPKFLGGYNLEEIGCMSEKEHNDYWINQRIINQRNRELQQRQTMQDLQNFLEDTSRRNEESRIERNRIQENHNRWVEQFNRDQRNYQQERELNRSLDKLNKSVDSINNKLGY